MVYNVFDNRVVPPSTPYYGSPSSEYPYYKIAQSQSQPRYVRFGVNYDF